MLKEVALDLRIHSNVFPKSRAKRFLINLPPGIHSESFLCVF